MLISRADGAVKKVQTGVDKDKHPGSVTGSPGWSRPHRQWSLQERVSHWLQCLLIIINNVLDLELTGELSGLHGMISGHMLSCTFATFPILPHSVRLV